MNSNRDLQRGRRASAVARMASALTLLAAGANTGCVLTKYKAADDGTPPAVMLNVSAAQPPIEAVLHTVIVLGGPGSWKRAAYWDEYMVSFVNRGGDTVAIEWAALASRSGARAFAGVDPWAIEKQSHALGQKNYGLGKDTAVQLGSGLATVGVGAGLGFLWGTAISSAGSAAMGGSALTAGGSAAVAAGGIVAVPAFVAGSMALNKRSRQEIERVFRRRQLTLPRNVASGETAEGSFFFPITPGPQRLTVGYKLADNPPCELVIDLAAISNLHLAAH